MDTVMVTMHCHSTYLVGTFAKKKKRSHQGNNQVALIRGIRSFRTTLCISLRFVIFCDCRRPDISLHPPTQPTNQPTNQKALPTPSMRIVLYLRMLTLFNAHPPRSPNSLAHSSNWAKPFLLTLGRMFAMLALKSSREMGRI